MPILSTGVSLREVEQSHAIPQLVGKSNRMDVIGPEECVAVSEIDLSANEDGQVLFRKGWFWDPAPLLTLSPPTLNSHFIPTLSVDQSTRQAPDCKHVCDHSHVVVGHALSDPDRGLAGRVRENMKNKNLVCVANHQSLSGTTICSVETVLHREASHNCHT